MSKKLSFKPIIDQWEQVNEAVQKLYSDNEDAHTVELIDWSIVNDTVVAVVKISRTEHVEL